jgi:hypothetical protein
LLDNLALISISKIPKQKIYHSKKEGTSGGGDEQVEMRFKANAE